MEGVRFYLNNIEEILTYYITTGKLGKWKGVYKTEYSDNHMLENGGSTVLKSRT